MSLPVSGRNNSQSRCCVSCAVVLGVRPADPGRIRQLLRTIQQALGARRQIEGVYREPGSPRPTKMQLQPRRVLLCEHAWHLVAHDNREDSTNLYRLSPFESVKLLDTPTTVDPDFSLRNLLGNAWSVSRGEQDYRVELPIPPGGRSAGGRLPLAPHPGDRETGGRLAGLPGDRQRTRRDQALDLGLGPQATVLKPNELADGVRRLAEETLQRYRQPRSGKRHE